MHFTRSILDHIDAVEEGAMTAPATALWGLSLSDADFEKLKAGYEPEDMNEKWRIAVKDPDQRGNMSIYITRSWSGLKFYILAVKSSAGGSLAQIETITWEQNKGGIHISEEQGKKDVVILCRALLDCEFVDLPNYDFSDLWNHPAAQIDTN